jgi:hypothetical protein
MIRRTYVRLHATAKTVNDVPERLLTMYPVCTLLLYPAHCRGSGSAIPCVVLRRKPRRAMPPDPALFSELHYHRTTARRFIGIATRRVLLGTGGFGRPFRLFRSLALPTAHADTPTRRNARHLAP